MDADHRRLVRAATRLLGPAEAEDAVQDAYVRALETAPTGLNAAQAWLLTVVRHLAVDRLRRRDWMRHWLDAMHGEASGPTASLAPSAERVATLAEEVAQALRLMASHLTPMDGAALLLHEVFEVEHAEIAHANGQSETASRQRLRRALARLRQAVVDAGGTRRRREDGSVAMAPEAPEDLVFRQYLDSLRLRDPRSLWAMLRQPPISATAARSARPVARPVAPSPDLPAMPASGGIAASGVLQVGGQLGLVLTLDGVTLCVLPLGVRTGDEREDPTYSTISV
ncbi:sigma-70 family RNA polymerase sigma factor [Roseateles chitinivorans]|uniref:sigma-70 family RNA polymerase sigma factor n=1 Tax=Roseateles chitinivorans TaxID=2917965 RepID=UPI003D66D36C